MILRIFYASMMTLAVFFATSCTSDRSKVEEMATQWKSQAIAAKATKDAQSIDSPWLRQAYQDYVVKNTEVEVLKSEIQGETATVEFQTRLPQEAILGNLLGVAQKISPDGARNFNFADGAVLVQKQLKLSEVKTSSPPETLTFQKGPNGWRVQD